MACSTPSRTIWKVLEISTPLIFPSSLSFLSPPFRAHHRAFQRRGVPVRGRRVLVQPRGVAGSERGGGSIAALEP